MNLTDNIFNQVEELFIHKNLVNQSCLKMARYLSMQQNNDLALELLRRAAKHDNSKLDDNELEPFTKLGDEKSSLKDPNIGLDDKTKNVIEIHWHKNRHHPEYFEDVNKMSEIDIIEMCCDWHARSVQYHTDLLEFVKIRQENRFHFNEENYEKIIKYCNILSQD